MSREHFSVDGTLIEAWASLKSFKKKDASKKDEPPPDDPGNPSVDFHGEKHGNETHESTTDPNAKLARKGMGKEAKLSYSAHALIENRNGLLVAFQMDGADGRAERRNALEMLDECLPGKGRVTVGGDKGYDTRDFVEACRERTSRRTSRRTPTSVVARRSMNERRGSPATRSANASASASRRSSAG